MDDDDPIVVGTLSDLVVPIVVVELVFVEEVALLGGGDNG